AFSAFSRRSEAQNGGCASCARPGGRETPPVRRTARPFHRIVTATAGLGLPRTGRGARGGAAPMPSAVLTAFIATKTDVLTPLIGLVEQSEASPTNGSLRGKPDRGRCSLPAAAQYGGKGDLASPASWRAASRRRSLRSRPASANRSSPRTGNSGRPATEGLARLRRASHH